MILGLFSLFIAFSSSKLLDSYPPHSDEVQPPTSQTQGFVPGKIVFSVKQKIIILITIIISVILIIIGIVIACKLGKKTKKNPDLSEIEKFMLPPSSSPFSNM